MIINHISITSHAFFLQEHFLWCCKKLVVQYLLLKEGDGFTDLHSYCTELFNKVISDCFPEINQNNKFLVFLIIIFDTENFMKFAVIILWFLDFVSIPRCITHLFIQEIFIDHLPRDTHYVGY